MADRSHQLLDPESVSRISRLELEARHVVEGFLSGLHRSPYFGQSIEFVQHREYVPGDDVRKIDWKVWSKTDKFYIKQYEEETNLRTALLVDASESMQYGSGGRSKFDYACSIAACLSYLLLRQQDAVSLSTFDSKLRNRIPSRSQQTHLNALLAALEVESPQSKTNIYSILRQVAEEKSQRGMVVLISDLFTPREDLFRGLRLLRKRGHDVLIFHVLDDQELDFDFTGTTKFEGLEQAGELVCDPRSLREGYQQALNEFLHEIRRRCARNVIDYQTIRTSEHLDAVLRHYVNHRVGMRGTARN
ncbi:MAG: DUF58 domain-containing protein [Planctomycetaceae bacterium]|nr:DUF58 domain-containing protein [Planctomycetaceae bacterium]